MPIYFEWTKDMSVGEDHIDIQHQKLLMELTRGWISNSPRKGTFFIVNMI